MRTIKWAHPPSLSTIGFENYGHFTTTVRIAKVLWQSHHLSFRKVGVISLCVAPTSRNQTISRPDSGYAKSSWLRHRSAISRPPILELPKAEHSTEDL